MGYLHPRVFKYNIDTNNFLILFFSIASVWRQHVKLISPFFGASSVYESLPVFNTHLSKLITKMTADVDKGVFDIRKQLNYATIDMILETTLGHAVDVFHKQSYIAFMAK